MTRQEQTVTELLEFERGHWKQTGHKTEAVRLTFGIPIGTYYLRLLGAIQTREAREHDPVLVRQITERWERASHTRLRLIFGRKPAEGRRAA